MYHTARFRFGTLKWVSLGILAVLVFLVIFSYLVPVAAVNDIKVREAESYDNLTMTDSSNAVTAAIAVAESHLMRGLDMTEQSVFRSSRITANTLSRSGHSISQGAIKGASVITDGAVDSLAFVARSTIELTAFAVHAPASVLGYAANTTIVNAVIKPVDSTSQPVIEASVPANLAIKPTLTPIETVSKVSAPQSVEADWPIRGDITTLFGVPHWPYQPTHTGIDISDGRPSGVTPIKPFKPGVVTEAVLSYRGLGNHVTIDHGEGMKSVYAHLSSISVQVGQTVNMNTVLGFEGSTGASTGTHLHFEIWVNGQVQNPLNFIRTPL